MSILYGDPLYTGIDDSVCDKVIIIQAASAVFRVGVVVVFWRCSSKFLITETWIVDSINPGQKWPITITKMHHLFHG